MLTSSSLYLIAGGIAMIIIVGFRITYMIKSSGIYWAEYVRDLAKNPLNL
jgi:hypothetical protein